MGFRIGKKGIRINPAKVEAITDWPKPRTVKEIQEFLGFANYNRKFIKGYSQIIVPLTRLIKKDTPFIWNDQKKQAFQQIKDRYAQEPILKLFDPKKSLRMETDISDLALRACLRQEYNDKWHPIAYYSRKLSPAEQNYDIHDKELLAIMASLEV